MKVPTVKMPSGGGGDLVASRILSVGPCKLLALVVFNNNANTQYVQVHETAVLPANNAVPALPSIPVATGSVTMFDFGPNGIDLDACVVCNSSTPEKKTIGVADCSIVGVFHG